MHIQALCLPLYDNPWRLVFYPHFTKEETKAPKVFLWGPTANKCQGQDSDPHPSVPRGQALPLWGLQAVRWTGSGPVWPKQGLGASCAVHTHSLLSPRQAEKTGRCRPSPPSLPQFPCGTCPSFPPLHTGVGSPVCLPALAFLIPSRLWSRAWSGRPLSPTSPLYREGD